MGLPKTLFTVVTVSITNPITNLNARPHNHNVTCRAVLGSAFYEITRTMKDGQRYPINFTATATTIEIPSLSTLSVAAISNNAAAFIIPHVDYHPFHSRHRLAE